MQFPGDASTLFVLCLQQSARERAQTFLRVFQIGSTFLHSDFQLIMRLGEFRQRIAEPLLANLQGFAGLALLMHVRVRAKPAQHFALFVPHWYRSSEKPSKNTIGSE